MEGQKKLECHPAANLFPLLTGKKFDSLKNSIAEHGQLEPILLFKGRILDGRNRYRACCELGITPQCTVYAGNNPYAQAWALNGERRHLNQSQRAMIARKLLPEFMHQAKERKRHGSTGPGKCLPSRDSKRNPTAAQRAAALVGVSGATIHRIMFVERNDPSLLQRIESGDLTAYGARRLILGETIKRQTLTTPKARAERVTKARELAKEGYRAAQIAEKLGIVEAVVRRYATEEGIELPDAHLKSRNSKISAARVIAETVDGLAGYAAGLRILNGALANVETDDAVLWLSSLNESLPILQRLRKTLQRLSR